MSDEEQRMGDGQDNYADGARKAANAAKQFGAASAKSTGAAAGEAAANIAAATVKAGVEGGKAVSEIAAGTAAGGPWGAAIAAAWSLRHTLFKILIFVCLFLLFIIVAIVSLPSVVSNNVFRFDPSSVNAAGPTEFGANFDDLSAVITACIEAGHTAALARVDTMIAEGGYDEDLSKEALTDNAMVSPDYDFCYILAAYSASMGQRGSGKADMKAKLEAVADQMFEITYEVKEKDVTVPPPPDHPEAEPTTETVKFIACTIHPFDQSVILTAFGVDVNATYDQFGITYGDAISTMAYALRMTLLGGTDPGGSIPAVDSSELAACLASLTCSDTRREVIATAFTLVGRVPYFWGGKSAPGWNSEWNTPKLVTIAGSQTSGTIQPYGLDCSGFTNWVYQTALGVDIGSGTTGQWNASTAITESQLRPGDLGFMASASATGASNHVLIYVGRDASGNKLWVHCASGSGVVLSTASYARYFRRPSGVDLEA